MANYYILYHNIIEILNLTSLFIFSYLSCCFPAGTCYSKEFKGTIDLLTNIQDASYRYSSAHIICDKFPQRGNTGVYSAAVFTMMKTGSGGTRDANAVDRERIYAAVKAFGLD